MGYYATFTLKAPLDSQFKGFMRDVKKEDLTKYKNILLAIAMKSQVDEPDNYALEKAYSKINYAVRQYILICTEDWKANHHGDIGTEYGFCGWDLCRSNLNVYNYGAEEDRDPIKELEMSVTERIFFDAIEVVPGRFEKDNDTYDEKFQEISSWCDYISDEVWEIMNKKFVTFYRAHPELADEVSDDSPTREPERKEESTTPQQPIDIDVDIEEETEE